MKRITYMLAILGVITMGFPQFSLGGDMGGGTADCTQNKSVHRFSDSNGKLIAQAKAPAKDKASTPKVRSGQGSGQGTDAYNY